MSAQIGPPAAAIRAHEELFAYWSSLKAGAPLPTRDRLHPEGMKRLLPTVSLIEVLQGDGLDYRMRLAGTGLYHVYGREITGRHESDAGKVMTPSQHLSRLRVVGLVSHDARPDFGRTSGRLNP